MPDGFDRLRVLSLTVLNVLGLVENDGVEFDIRGNVPRPAGSAHSW